MQVVAATCGGSIHTVPYTVEPSCRSTWTMLALQAAAMLTAAMLLGDQKTAIVANLKNMLGEIASTRIIDRAVLLKLDPSK